MCKASMEVTNTRDAESGDEVILDITTEHMPYFIRVKDLDTNERAVTCVKCGRKMTLTDIPLSVQNALTIPREIEVIFIEHGDHTSDAVYYNGTEISLWDIAYAAALDSSVIGVIMQEMIPQSELDEILTQLEAERSDGDYTYVIVAKIEEETDEEIAQPREAA